MNIYTNNHRHYPVWGCELNQKEKKYWESLLDNVDDYEFIYYKNNYYLLNDFMRTCRMSDEFKGWDGYISDTFFSGVLIKYNAEHESYQLATYYS